MLSDRCPVCLSVCLSVCLFVCNLDVLWPNGWMDQGGTSHGGRPRSRPHCARWGPSSPPPKRGQSLLIFVPFYCGQTARCIKMPLGTVELAAPHVAGKNINYETALRWRPNLRRLRLGEEKRRTRMWADAQRDARPAKYRWRPLFNAAKFG